MKRKKIPVHIDELGKTGVSVEFVNTDQAETYLLKAHRDDHYIFLLQQKGSIQVMLDFNSITLKDACVFFIKPGQVHYYSRRKIVGWFLAVSPAIIEKDLRNYLDKLTSQFLFLKETRKLTTILKLVDKTAQSPKPDNFELKELQSYANAFIAIVCSSFSSSQERSISPQSRLSQITTAFQQFLKKHFRTLKKPADYANLLCISTSYLNETLIKTTGFSTSYWIQQELFLEAKRLLHHTELTAKEIAFELGFEDHTYFTRLFKKVNGITPMNFRKAYRDLSN
ncbi:hypothetical protein A8C56_17080 [Niabella ginsenosidivorans]|uniref:HTH araC/xylS-type domain-containing protein n=1 Tax=Niabella ginsenosidivorans TaxID=1176587 RepID=A0A1A9I4H3_9BACT|nr:AraC family transcriptional regulator [Niabella ginsenosidivorans]ANH82453.1 hypothetical protein A8C56_17080 [Niabella ginsenosidivorans]